MIIWGRK